jgi:hypothetical protein
MYQLPRLRDGVDDLQLEPAIERLEVVGPPGPHARIAHRAERLATKADVRQDRGHLQQRVLRGASANRIGGAQRHVGVEKREQRKPKGILHPRTPVPLAPLALKDRERIGHRPIAVPTQTGIEQVEPERPRPIGDVQKHHVRSAVVRDHTQGSLCQIAVRVHQQDRASRLGLHGMQRQAQHQRRFAAAGLGDHQQMSAEHVGWQCHRHLATLMPGHADAAALGNREWQRQPASGRGAFEQCDVGRRMG